MEIPKYIIKIVFDATEKCRGGEKSKELYITSDCLPIKKDGFIIIGRCKYNTDKVLYLQEYDNAKEIIERYYRGFKPKGKEIIFNFKMSWGSNAIGNMVNLYENGVT